MVKRCLIVTYYFPPAGGGGVQRIVKFIKYLSRNNWQFDVITSYDASTNLPRDENLAKELPANLIISKISNPLVLKKKSIIGYVFSFFKSTFFMRWVNSVIFLPDMYKTWISEAKKEILLLLQKKKFEIILISSPPYSLSVLAAELTQIISIPVVLDMRDPWTTNPYKIYPTKWHFKKDTQTEFDVINKVKYGISAYKSLIDFYQSQISGFQSKIWKYIPNGYDEEDFKFLVPQQPDGKKLNIAFSGTFYSHINNPVLLLKTISSLETEIREKIRFHHIGNSNISLKKIAASLNLSSNIVEWGYRSHKECLNILAGMDIFCFILDSANPKSKNTIGGKVYEYIRLKKPILALVPVVGEAANLINKLNAGIVVDPYDHKAISEILTKWVKDKPGIAKSVNCAEYERSVLAAECRDLFDSILGENQI